ncbi:MAG: TIGR01212 family radical SAM protein [Clostridia bacterium]|nr:TIGR01212 family radical SAM protein [Clostridia bacterium]
MENSERYNHLNKYLKNKFGERTLKICVDGNFTCPNRDGTLGKGGCIFCSEQGSGEHLKNKLKISEQVTSFLNSYRGERANKFIVYFQNFSNTYDTIENLKQKYNSSLIDNRIVGLSVATRPDCINEEIVKLLATYKEKYYVCVELGLQTSNNTTGKIINRGYTSEDFNTAVKLLNEYNIDVVTHIMVGLPGETRKDLENTIEFLNKHDLQGLKIHSTYVVKNTVLEKMYLSGNYIPITLEAYLEDLVYIITHINPDIIIHRISGDAPKESLVAPSWNTHKKLVLNGLDKILREKNLKQGMNYEKNIIN